MKLCVKGCGRAAKVRGMCKSHYTMQLKRDLYLNRSNTVRSDAVGVECRLRALVAIGWTQRYLGDQLGYDPSWVAKLLNNPRRRVNRDTYQAVADLYDRLSMTPGPSQEARDRAKRKGWKPPLAWDDDAIDCPEATPDLGEKRTVTWGERFLELRELGYSDFDILGKLKIQPDSMLRQMDRYGIPVQRDFITFAGDAKYRKTAS